MSGAPKPPDLGEPRGGLLPEEYRGDGPELYHFPHPQWTVGVVLVLAVMMIFLGLFGHPVWFLIGSPFILTLGVWLYVRMTGRADAT